MFIKNRKEVKELIQNNIELFRLHDMMSLHRNQADVISISGKARFNPRRIIWYTLINSLFSSIVMVREFMNTQGHPANMLDNSFTLAGWHIHSCRQFDIKGNPDSKAITLGTILRRMRNSVGHGLFEIEKPPGEDSPVNWFIVFHDENHFAKGSDKSKQFFELKIKTMEVPKFLEKLEACFKAQYP